MEDQAEDQASLSVLLAEDAEGRGWVNEIEVFESGEAFLSAAGTFGIVFLDVSLGGIDGLETARRFRDRAGTACRDGIVRGRSLFENAYNGRNLFPTSEYGGIPHSPSRRRTFSGMQPGHPCQSGARCKNRGQSFVARRRDSPTREPSQAAGFGERDRCQEIQCREGGHGMTYPPKSYRLRNLGNHQFFTPYYKSQNKLRNRCILNDTYDGVRGWIAD